MNNWFKRNSIHFLIGAIFLVISFIYFAPAFQGKTLGQNDVTRAQSTQKEINDYRAKDTTILWTNQILGGMPAFQIWAPYSSSIATKIVNFLDTVFPSPIYIVFLLMFGSYFLFSVLKIDPWLGATGALAFTFSSYNIIYIAAGHANQEFAIALFAPIVASIIMILRGKKLMGASLLALFLSIEIKANHLQMTYYLLIALLILMLVELYQALKKKDTKPFLQSVAYIGVAVVISLLVNAAALWSTSEYAPYSIRGKSNLSHPSATQASNGVSRDYAYEYSEGVSESLTFLVPNLYGGGSAGPTGDDSHVAKVLISKGADATQAQNIAQSLPLYWGEKTFTEGPWYFGAIVCFLFIYGLFIVKSHLKWWLLITVVLTMFLSFGKNLPFLSDLFFHYFPMYNKFRAVESILALTMLCVPVLAIMAISESIENTDKTYLFKKAKIAFFITAGISLLFVVLPDLFLNYKSSTHQQLITQLTNFTRGDAAVANEMANALVADRVSAARADAIRSLIFVIIGFGITWAFLKGKINNKTIVSVAFLVVILVDLWTVDKRYLKTDQFVDRQDVQKPRPREVDEFIMRDKDPDFRVIDLTQNLMTDATTPYFYKSIGGYSAARMKRYDEMIENQFSKSLNHDILDMLNTKYFITADKSQNLTMMANPTACGHAWFVKSIKYAKNADEEMQAISSFSPKDEAIVDQQYKKVIDEKMALSRDTSGTIKLVSYNPDHLVYQSGSTSNEVAVFSEIYYEKGWKMLIDGVEKPYFRADYVLRAAQIPVGNHKVEFIFHPASYYTGEKISLAGSVLLVLVLGGAAYTGWKKREKEVKKEPAKKA